jgi:hypothetical protein
VPWADPAQCAPTLLPCPRTVLTLLLVLRGNGAACITLQSDR